MFRLPRWIGLPIIALLLLAVMGLSLPGQLQWQRVLQDAAHGPVFAIIAIVLLLMRPASPSGRVPADYVWSFLVTCGLGIATELLQRFQPGRTVSLSDAIHDAAGAAFGLAVVAYLTRRRKMGSMPGAAHGLSARWSGEGAVALVAAAVLTCQPLECALAYAHRAREFPVLISGSSGRDLYFARCVRCDVTRDDRSVSTASQAREPVLRIRYVAHSRPRFELFEPARNWKGYRNLGVDLVNPNPLPLPLVLKIQDADHDLTTRDRLNLQLRLSPGESRRVLVPLSVVEFAPANRSMDLTRIANVALFLPSAAPADGEFLVGRIWLE